MASRLVSSVYPASQLDTQKGRKPRRSSSSSSIVQLASAHSLLLFLFLLFSFILRGLAHQTPSQVETYRHTPSQNNSSPASSVTINSCTGLQNQDELLSVSCAQVIGRRSENLHQLGAQKPKADQVTSQPAPKHLKILQRKPSHSRRTRLEANPISPQAHPDIDIDIGFFESLERD